MTNLEKLNEELNRLFDLFNVEYYGGALRKPVIAVQTNGGRGRQRLSMGWCSCDKIWKDHSTNDYYYEITICSEYLYRSVEEICATLLHEMVHLFCNEHGIKDTSRGNTYHNKRFKELAESHGLIISYDERIGWSNTRLSEATAVFVGERADKSAFVVTRERHTPPQATGTATGASNGEGGETVGGEPENGSQGTTEPQKPKQSLKKYVCPKCGCIIRASREVNVFCGECKVAFEIEA